MKDANNAAFPINEKQRLNKLDFTTCAKDGQLFFSVPASCYYHFMLIALVLFALCL
ncbi:hypothetical protein BAXH7_00186 [Bacillus amyloliquefaciens XH7]|nr:hypothetical protein BAMTA208_00925 [Bacillus amyloliquefaciens TA208]AEB61736.1 hypothetical protein LL3_00181 [Bacillus amyloliquefaciens LL3]AEK87336.1 hypothetical protein BAXH7_00186 [Bacillus amyloliquefaciens XH7]KYC96911.1 hypothetical protein B425_0183 [Bacillus amyloliquefaciens]QBG54594.1 hypothetical protein D2M30_0229 [Bacillus amyloliquefaciens]